MKQTRTRPRQTVFSPTPDVPALGAGAGNTLPSSPALPVHSFARLRLTEADPAQQPESQEIQREESSQEASGEDLATADVSSVVSEGLASGGRPLDPDTRAFMEPRFGHDFSQVRVHDNPQASSSASAVAARAYTLGSNIAFRSGEFAPGSGEGRRLLAHELTHVVQQGAAAPLAPTVQRDDIPDPNTQNPAPTANANTGTSDLDSAYYGAVALGDWQKAAEVLNGFSADDIQKRSSMPLLSQDQINRLYQGALDNPRVGPQSQVAQILAPRANATPSVAPPPGSGAGGTAPANDVPIWQGSTTDKLLEAVKRSAQYLGPELGNRLDELKSPQAIALMLAFTGAFILMEGTPVGWIAMVATAAMIGKELSTVVDLVGDFVDKCVNTHSDADLDTAGHDLAQAATKIGVDVLLAILLHKAGKAVKPYMKPPPGIRDMVTPDGIAFQVSEDTIPDNASATKGGGTTTDPNTPTRTAGSLEGKKEYIIDDPADPGRTITDIDSIEGNVLWEEKTATDAINRKTGDDETANWVAKNVTKKFASYLDARQYMPGYEKADIGFRFTKPGASPSFQTAVEAEIARLTAANPNVVIHLEWR